MPRHPGSFCVRAPYAGVVDPSSPRSPQTHDRSVRLVPMDAAGSDRDDLIGFLSANSFPFHGVPRPDAASAAAAIASGVWSGPDTAAFWVVHETCGRVGTLRLDDLADPTVMPDLRLGEEFRGRGLAAPILRAATAHPFEGFPHVRRFEGQTREDNVAMRRAFARCGWVQEAHYRDGWPVAGGEPMASIASSILRRDVRGPAVVLTGLLVCADEEQAQTVRAHLPAHVAATRAEPGCDRFEVEPDADGRTWHVAERFVDEVFFDAHQQRAADSAWGRATAGIERRYTVERAVPPDVVARAWAAEERLLRPEVRRDPAAVGALLAADFAEVGQSGRRWTRDEIIASLAAAEPGPYDARLDEREGRVVAPDLVLLTYLLRAGDRSSRRSALWRCDPDPRCVWHQGTPVP